MDSRAYDLLGELGLGGVFLGTIIEALGIPFPGGLMLVLAGVLINRGSMDYPGAVLLAVAGFNLGATAAYYVGRMAGDPLFGRLERFFKIDRQKIDRAREWMDRSAAAFILIGRFVPMASNLTPYLAGMSRLHPARFLFYNVIFAIAWANFNIALGFYFSKSLRTVLRYTEAHLPFIAGAALVLYLAAALIVRRRYKL